MQITIDSSESINNDQNQRQLNSQTKRQCTTQDKVRAPGSDQFDGGAASRFGNFHNYYTFNPISKRFCYLPTTLPDVLLEIQKQCAEANPDAERPPLGQLRFLDVGCNEGDITLAMSSFLASNASHLTTTPDSTSNITNPLRGVSGIGMDIDTVLISRAIRKSAALQQTLVNTTAVSNIPSTIFLPISVRFSQADIVKECGGIDVTKTNTSAINTDTEHLTLDALRSMQSHLSEEEIREKTKEKKEDTQTINNPLTCLGEPYYFPSFPTFSFFAPDNAKSVNDATEDNKINTKVGENCVSTNTTSVLEIESLSTLPIPTPRSLDIVFLFSVTMWIHLNAGDEGLQVVLRQLAASTNNIIVEPQPWKCYLTCRKRWRKAGQPESPHWDTLKWRLDVDEQIVQFLVRECGFKIHQKLGETHWGRQLVWLVRKGVRV